MADTLVLEGRLDLAAVGTLHTALLEKAGQDVVIDLADVKQFGALCAQVCVAAARNAHDSGTGFSIINATDHVLAQLNSMGMSPESIAEGLQ